MLQLLSFANRHAAGAGLKDLNEFVSVSGGVAMQSQHHYTHNQSLKRTAQIGVASQCYAALGSLRSFAAPAARLAPRYAYSEMFLVEFGAG